MSDDIIITASEPRPIDNLFDLIRHLPDGDVAVVRAPSNWWDVVIFARESTQRVATVAHDMDRGTATFLAAALRGARPHAGILT